MILQTKHLLLRPWEESDAQSLYEYAKDPAVGPSAGWQPHQSVDESRKIILTVLNGAQCYAVCLREDNRAIGSVELFPHEEAGIAEGEYELGYWLGKPFWGRGLMTEAAAELVRHGFEALGLSVIWCGYYDGNVRSKRVQEKLGFSYHHTRQNVRVAQMNEVRTNVLSILTKEQWLRQRSAPPEADGCTVWEKRC